MDVGVDAPGGDNFALPRDDFRGWPDHQFRVHAGHRIRVARFAHLYNPPVFDADVAFDNAPVVHNQRVGNHQIQRAGRFAPGHPAALAHPVPDDFATTKGDLVAVDGEILLHFDNQFRISQPHPVAGGGAVEIGVGAPGNG